MYQYIATTSISSIYSGIGSCSKVEDIEVIRIHLYGEKLKVSVKTGGAQAIPAPPFPPPMSIYIHCILQLEL